ncbi:hypothetical protein P389DRAFT_181633 [Cystobasidium minutum MCA 4210]|uniref:uncharacterized protein n=1 Tax=Cystobasidium minutum MCA 4210 TaxID=1397322 RepID=UPI0034CFAE10|eukprot:jgi/Rhomi1/181633/fgenesh1_pg.7_\
MHKSPQWWSKMVPGSMHVSNEARPIRLASMHAVSIRQKFSHAGMVRGVRVVVHSNYMLVGVTGSKAAPVSAAANVHTAPYRTSRRRCAIRSGAIWDAFSPVGIVWSVEGAVDRTSMAVEATGIRASILLRTELPDDSELWADVLYRGAVRLPTLEDRAEEAAELGYFHLCLAELGDMSTKPVT